MLCHERVIVTDCRGYRLRSSFIRSLCPHCGTHLAFILDGAAELDVTVGSLDDPTTAKPGYHIFADTRLPWLQLADELPEYDD